MVKSQLLWQSNRLFSCLCVFNSLFFGFLPFSSFFFSFSLFYGPWGFLRVVHLLNVSLPGNLGPVVVILIVADCRKKKTVHSLCSTLLDFFGLYFSFSKRTFCEKQNDSLVDSGTVMLFLLFSLFFPQKILRLDLFILSMKCLGLDSH